MIGIIAAMDVEAARFKSLMTDKIIENISGTEFVRGRLWGKDTVIAVSGVGKVNAAICTQTMIMKYAPEFIINSGVAGGLEKSLRICDVVVARDVVQHDMDTSPLGDPVGFISGLDIVNIPCDERIYTLLAKATEKNGVSCKVGTIASGDRFINSSEKKTELISEFNAYACEMEGGAIGHVCFKNKVPFAVIRSISDGADDSSHLSYTEFVEVAADNLVKIMESFFEAL